MMIVRLIIDEGEERHLSSFGLVLDILCWADLGLDVLEVRQWLVDDAELLGCGCRRLGWGADHGHLPLLGNQAQGAWGSGGPWGRWVAGRGSWGDGCGARGAGGRVATASWAGAHWFCNWWEEIQGWRLELKMRRSCIIKCYKLSNFVDFSVWSLKHCISVGLIGLLIVMKESMITSLDAEILGF